MGTGDTWTATGPGATDPTTCPERDPMTSTAAIETTGATEITTTGVREALGHQELSVVGGAQRCMHWCI